MKILKKINYDDNFFITTPAIKPKLQIPMFVNDNNNGISIPHALIVSILLHLIIIGILWFLFTVIGINLQLFQKSTPEIKDIEFTIIAPKTKEIIEKSKPVKEKSVKKTLSSAPQKKLKGSKHPAPFKLSRTPHKGSFHSKSKIPAFAMPKFKTAFDNEGFGTKGSEGYFATSTQSGNDGNDNRNSIGKGKRGGYGTGGSLSSGHAQNSIFKAPDINPYITELQRRVRANWIIPKGNEDKKVVLFLRIGKGGNLIILNVKDTSSNGDVDNAALAAVKKTLPFKPLPNNFKENYLDVILKFDYNVLARSN